MSKRSKGWVSVRPVRITRSNEATARASVAGSVGNASQAQRPRPTPNDVAQRPLCAFQVGPIGACDVARAIEDEVGVGRGVKQRLVVQRHANNRTGIFG